jgi:hypothetical protein
MRNVEVNSQGRMVYWTLGGKTDAERLEDALDVVGLKKYAPSSNTAKISLKLAMQSVCPKGVRFIRDLKGERGYSVVSQRKNPTTGELTFRVDFSGTTDLEGDITFRVGEDVPDGVSLSRDNTWPSREQIIYDIARVRSEALAQSTNCQASTVARSLVGIVDKLHGIPLRESGGIYWIPEQALPRWEQVAQAFMQYGGGSNIIYGVKTEVDEATAFAIMDALVRDIKKEREQMEDRFNNLEHGAADSRHKRALDTMEKRIKTLHNRVKGYEGIVGKNLDGLRAELTECEQVLGFSVLANAVGL